MGRWLALLGINLVVLAVLLGAVELVLRGREPESVQGEMEFVETSLRLLQPCAVLESTEEGTFLVGGGAGDPLPFRYQRESRPEVLRLAVIGGSSGVMLANQIQEMLAASPAKSRFEMINCAASGAALEHVERRAREALSYDPDVLIVVFGHNVDFEYPLDERQLEIASLRRQSRLLWRVASAIAGDSKKVAKTPLPRRLEVFEKWLRELAERSERQGLHLVLATLADNLWTVPRTTGEAIVAPQFLSAVFDYAVDERRGREEMTQLATENDEALWLFTAGVWQARAGHVAEAKVSLRRALDAEPPAYGREGQSRGRDRASSAVNSIIRRVAREEGVALLDMHESTASKAADGLPGWDVMQDHCHLQFMLFLREAQAAFDLAQDAAGLASARRISLSNSNLVEDRARRLRWVLDEIVYQRRARELNAWQIGVAVERLLRVVPREGRVAVEGLLASQVDPRPHMEILTGVAWGYWNVGERDQAMEINRRARATPFADPWVQLGLFALRLGDRQQAEQAFVQALALEAGRPDATLFLERLRRGAVTRGSESLD